MFTVGPALRGGADSDPFWSYVKTLLHFDGSLTDSAPVPLTWNFTDSAATAPAAALFGSEGLDLRSTSSDGIVVSGASTLALGTSDFCIEGWFNDTDQPAKNSWWFYLGGSVDSIGIWTLPANTFVPNGGGSSGLSNQAYPLNTWLHIAIARDGNTMRCFLNGVVTHSWDCTGWTHGLGNTDIRLGRSSGPGSGRKLMIDEFRVTVGVPRYTGAFTPAGPFPNRGP